MWWSFKKFLNLFTILAILVSIPVGIYLVGQATGFFGRAGGTPANLVIDASSSFPDSHYSWKNLAQGGEEKGRMLASVIDKVANLHPNYIRIDHVFDMYDVIQGGPGQITFNWSNLDQTLNDITATGAKPFISLSYMPPSISKSGDPVDLPTNWSDWEFIVQRLVEHVSGTLGIDAVYYEVWNEPDLFGNFKTYGPKNYFDLYAHSVAGATRAAGVKPFKIGGPATTQLYETWSVNFAKFVLASHLRLDFYSWHKYSMNLDNFENNALNAKVWLTEAGLPNDLELVISELGPNSKNDPVYDNSFGAIHAVAASVALEDIVSKVFTFEVKDGPVNKWGIITNEKTGAPTTKPRYNALLFLNNMAGNRVRVSGVGSWVKAFAKNDGKVIKTLVVNYDPSGAHTEAVPLNFTNLPSKQFRYRRVDWGGAVARDINVATSEANWTTYELMNPNTAAIFEITPQ